MSKTPNPHIRLITAVLTLAIWSTTAVAGIVYVDADAPGPVHDGESWCTAYNFLQDALTDPNLEPGDNILVADGTFRPDQDSDNPDGTDDRGETFKLINAIEIYGGYAGCGAPDPDERNTETYESILTGVLSSKNSYHVVTGSGTDATSVLDGFTITGGDAVGTAGGGMLNYDPPGSPTVVNCLFKGNSADDSGGGIANWTGSAPTIIGCSFENNSAAWYGGGIYNYNIGARPKILNCSFTGNSAEQYDGGGLCNDNSEPNVINCTFSNNTAGRHGGGTYNESTSEHLAFVNCIYTGNSAGQRGGGIYNQNTSENPDFINCIYTGNSAGLGGGICIWNGTANLFNCLFSGNTAQDGGAMYNKASDPCLINCTFAANVASGNGGGIFNNEPAFPTIANSVFWANTDTDGTGTAESAQIHGGLPDQITYSCIQDEDPNDGDIPFGEANIDDDPLFVRGPNAGGDGWGDDPCTPGIDEGANDDYGDLHLLPGSPCIDAADNTSVPADIHDLDDDLNTTELTPLDLDYNPRFIDDPETTNAGNPDPSHDPNIIVDMGPYEFAPEEGVAGDIDGDGDVDLVDFAILSLQWLDAPGDPSADIAPAGGDGEVNSDDLLVVAANWLTGAEAEVPAGEIVVNLSMDESWMYQNVGISTKSNLTANVSIVDDPAGNSSYTYIWEFDLPDDVTVKPSTKSGGGTADTSWNFVAPSVNQPEGLSDSGQAITVRVTVTGDDYANTGSVEAQFGIALLADVNNSAGINVADRSIINAFWRTGSAGSFTLRDCDVNSDGIVNVADRSIANAVWRGQLGQTSVSQPCPFR